MRRETIPCSRCGTDVTVKPHGRPKYCPPCGVVVNREKQLERNREVEADRRLLREVANNLRGYVTADMWARVEDYLDSLGLPPDSEPPIVPDRMPDGTMSDGGPDEGVSTNWKDLQQELDERRMRVIMHDWFTDNPRWLDGVND